MSSTQQYPALAQYPGKRSENPRLLRSLTFFRHILISRRGRTSSSHLCRARVTCSYWLWSCVDTVPRGSSGEVRKVSTSRASGSRDERVWLQSIWKGIYSVREQGNQSKGMRDGVGDNSHGEHTTTPFGIHDRSNIQGDDLARCCIPSKPRRGEGMLAEDRPRGRKYGRQTGSFPETQTQYPYDSGFGKRAQSGQMVARVSS